MPISFYHSLGGPPATVLQEIVTLYNNKDSNGEVVELVSFNPQEYKAAATEALSKPPHERPHLVLAPEYMTEAMKEALGEGIVISLENVLSEERKQDIAEIVKKTFGTSCLPLNPACGVLYINADLLVKAGYPADWTPTTFEDLIKASKAIKDATQVSGYTCAWPEAYLIEAMLAQKGQSLLDEAGNYNFAQLKDHIIHLRTLVKEGVFVPPNTGNYDATRQKLINGEVAFYMQGSGHFQVIESEAKKANFQIKYSPLPTLSAGQEGKDKYAFPLGGAAIWALNTEDQPSFSKSVAEGVRKFLDFMAQKEIQLVWHQKTGYVPVSQSIRKDNQEFYEQNPLHDAVVKQTIDAPLSDNSYGIKRSDYKDVRPKVYPMIRELLCSDGPDSEVEERLLAFDKECNKVNN